MDKNGQLLHNISDRYHYLQITVSERQRFCRSNAPQHAETLDHTGFVIDYRAPERLTVT